MESLIPCLAVGELMDVSKIKNWGENPPSVAEGYLELFTILEFIDGNFRRYAEGT